MKVELNAGTVARLEEQGELLLRPYNLELARDPNSHATASARSNLIALLHTITQIYAGSAALKVRSTLWFACAAL
ncbi:MAG TPA: hypothetical protein VFU48_13950 [Nitrospira sp.]|nr:hypothetical protein [Nitrospira sp.]